MKIGIYGGSFNPIHKGHIALAKFAIENLQLDKLFLVPANKSPDKKEVEYAPSKDRINIINLVLEDKMILSEFEIKRGGVSYTKDTINYFKSKFPNDELYFFIGTDNINGLNKWEGIDLMAKQVRFVAFQRGKEFSKINVKKYNVLLLNNPIYKYSSTDYKNGNLDMVEPQVQEYIGENFLYFEEIAKAWLFDKNTPKGELDRFLHLKWTAEFAAELAKLNNYRIKYAYQAGMAHDITKKWSVEKSYNFLSKYGYDKNNLKEYELHQTTAYYWLKDVYKYKNEEVLNAIRKHTTLDFELTLLDKILYVADKISKGRAWSGIEKYRKLSLNNLEEGFAAIVTKCADYESKERGVVFSQKQKEIYKKWGK